MYTVVKDEIGKFRYRPSPYPKRIHIEVTNQCNLSCPMCEREHFSRGINAQVSVAMFQAILDSLVGDQHRLILLGWGEPLLHPQIVELTRMAKARGSVETTTNGTLLTTELAQALILAGLDRLSFSIDTLSQQTYGHPDLGIFDKVSMFLNSCRQLGSSCTTRVITIVHPEADKDIEDIIERAGNLQLSEVFLLRVVKQLHQNLARPSLKEEIRTYANAIRLGRKHGIRVKNHWLKYTGLLGWLQLSLRPLQYGFDSKCYLTLNTVYITLEGKVTPCSALPTFEVGDVTSQSIAEIWKGARFEEFRQHQAAICGKCDFCKYRHRIS